MMKKGLIALLAVLFLITACGQGTTTSTTKANNSDTTANTKTEEKITPAESSLEYCKMILKTLQAQVNTYERQEKTIKDNIDETKKKIADLKATTGNEEKIREEQEDLDDLNERLQATQDDLAPAKKALADANTKCSKMAKKADRTICGEFQADLQERSQQTQDALTKEEANLANIKRQYDAAKSAGKSSEFLASIDDEVKKKNLDILKIKNNIDNLAQMATQLEEYC